MELLKPTTILDVGCGIGTWLKVFEENGIRDYKGIDGDYLNRALLKIPIDKFISTNLERPFDLKQVFDLVLCLEVVEHLSPHVTDAFLDSLVLHGDIILFSAAIPGQGGQHHVNEKWLSYWVKLFEERGYNYYDGIRPMIWNEKEVEVWYKQNMVFFVKGGNQYEDILKGFQREYKDIIHPDLFAFYANQAQRAVMYEQGELGISTAWNSLLKSIRKKLM